MGYTYDFPRPAVTVDNLIFTFENRELKILLIQRRNEPFSGEWALPGGFVDINESLKDAALRELREETGIDNAYIEQVHTFGEVDRDPRGRTISISYYAFVKAYEVNPVADSDAQALDWFSINELPDMAFDHYEIIRFATNQLKEKFKFHPVSFELLPDEFTLTELQRLIETVIDKPLDKRNFRKKILKTELLKELDPRDATVEVKRMATLYKFDRKRYNQIIEEGNKLSFF